jgi:hypothetical protein
MNTMIILLVAFIATSRLAPTSARVPERSQDDVVSLRIEDHTTVGTSHRYVLSYGTGATSCQLLVSFDTTGRVAGDTPYRFVRASLAHRDGCHPQSLLKALADAHGLKRVPRAGRREATLSLDAAIFGTQLSRGAVTRDVIAGEFTSARRGSWTVLKLFFGDDEAEVFLALDAASRRADLLVKDPEYGEPLLRELGRVLW